MGSYYDVFHRTIGRLPNDPDRRAAHSAACFDIIDERGVVAAGSADQARSIVQPPAVVPAAIQSIPRDVNRVSRTDHRLAISWKSERRTVRRLCGHSDHRIIIDNVTFGLRRHMEVFAPKEARPGPHRLVAVPAALQGSCSNGHVQRAGKAVCYGEKVPGIQKGCSGNRSVLGHHQTVH